MPPIASRTSAPDYVLRYVPAALSTPVGRSRPIAPATIPAMRVLITGCAGLLGSHLVDRFVAGGRSGIRRGGIRRGGIP